MTFFLLIDWVEDNPIHKKCELDNGRLNSETVAAFEHFLNFSVEFIEEKYKNRMEIKSEFYTHRHDWIIWIFTVKSYCAKLKIEIILLLLYFVIDQTSLNWILKENM